jgi:hypothetical protein
MYFSGRAQDPGFSPQHHQIRKGERKENSVFSNMQLLGSDI